MSRGWSHSPAPPSSGDPSTWAPKALEETIAGLTGADALRQFGQSFAERARGEGQTEEQLAEANSRLG